ncbi:MAG: aminotransferase class I/II-fold pyridoxal phosphate-dependent enzyme [Myxococcota bacterium]
MAKAPQLDTRLIHEGTPEPRPGGAVTMPIFQSATFEYGGQGSYDELRYVRLNNTPNHGVLHAKLRSLEGGEAAVVTSSGMAAITTTLLALLSPGEHVVAQRCVYGGTHDFMTETLARFGIEVSFVDADEPGGWARARRDTTRVLYAETMTNPLIEVADLPAAARFAKDHGLVSVIDNTFATPVLFRPLDHGFDVVVHSATKYLNGHSDIAAGAVVGRREPVDRIRHLLNHLGGTLDPHACFLLDRGLKTLAVRVRQQCRSAQTVAEFLQGHDAVTRVAYPGLAEHRGHARAQELFAGFGGMLSFELQGGAEAAKRVAATTKLFVNAPSLGGPESLITMPACTSHVGMDPDARRSLGITDGLVRLSIGLEDPADLVADLVAALS